MFRKCLQSDVRHSDYDLCLNNIAPKNTYIFSAFGDFIASKQRFPCSSVCETQDIVMECTSSSPIIIGGRISSKKFRSSANKKFGEFAHPLCCASAFYSFEIITNVSYLMLLCYSLWCGFGLLDIMAIYQYVGALGLMDHVICLRVKIMSFNFHENEIMTNRTRLE